MNSKQSIPYLILLAAPLFFSCSRPAKKQNNSTSPTSPISLHTGDENYVPIDTKESVVEYKGSMVIGMNNHTGYVNLSKGELMMEDGQLTGGTVEVDMNTIADKKHGGKNGLVDHLKSPDFFDVNKFRFSTIAITKVTSINEVEKEITGNLTIKGLTHPVSFPAKVVVKDGRIEANGKLVIDRTNWGIRYRSGKFFDDVKDEAIADDIEFTIHIVAKR